MAFSALTLHAYLQSTHDRLPMSKLYPLDANQAMLFTIFDSSSHSESLPVRPYCTDNLAQGIYPRLQRIAITKRYIQLNPPQQQHWLVFDIDRPHSAFAWEDANLPPPFAVVVNETNTHCHIVYALAAPVCTSDLAHEKPLRYLAAIQQAYTEKLQADVNYSGLIAKNPFSQNHWHVIPCAIHAKYTLDDLAEWVSLNGMLKRALRGPEAVALGRNCVMFDALRFYAYKSIRQYREGKVGVWREHIQAKAGELNVFREPLPESEVRAIAKSVANWVWQHMRQDSEKFIEKQRQRGKASGKARLGKANNHRVAAQALKNEGMRLSEIARTLGISQATVKKWKLE